MNRSSSQLRSVSYLCVLLALSACEAQVSSERANQQQPGGGGVVVTPTVANTTPNSTVPFAAAVAGVPLTAVTWSVVQSNGGTIQSSGLYTAPASTGSFTVVATSVADPTKSGIATVNVAAPSSTDPTGLIPDDRRTTWNPGLAAVGGIPVRNTVCATVSPSGGDDARAIQTAVTNCPAGQVVQLAAGTFHFNGASGVQIARSNVTLRGSVDANGRPSSKIMLSDDHTTPPINVGATGPDEGFLVSPSDLTADGALHANAIRVAKNPGYAAGELVTINQLHDASLFLNTSRFGTESAPTWRNMFCKTDRMIGQVLEIASVSGTGPYIVTFTTPLHWAYTVANKAQLWRHANYNGQPSTAITSPTKYVGIENIYIEGGRENGLIQFANTAYCWIKNFEGFRFRGPAITFTRTFRCEYRDSYVHQAQDPNPGGAGYILDINWQSADNLVENNIHWAANKVIVMRASGGGNVVGYNYFEDGFGSYYLNTPEAGLNASHFAGTHMELFEGNQSWNLWGDGVWGNSLAITFFRNHATGLRRNVNGTPYYDTGKVLHASNDFQNDAGNRRMVGIDAAHDWYNFVGNVLGYSGMPAPSGTWTQENTGLTPTAPTLWNIGTDGTPVGATQAQCNQTKARTLRHGNYDYVNRTVTWDPAITRHDLPKSLYLASPPSFFGANTWPWVDPTTGAITTLPARVRFDAMVAAGTLY